MALDASEADKRRNGLIFNEFEKLSICLVREGVKFESFEQGSIWNLNQVIMPAEEPV